jgi:hypothetical protein
MRKQIVVRFVVNAYSFINRVQDRVLNKTSPFLKTHKYIVHSTHL